MTVQELHIDVRNQLQRLSANRNRKLDDDQIDWLLNQMQTTMIESSVVSVPGSSRVSIKKDKYNILAGLLVPRKIIPAYWQTDRYISPLPYDYIYMVDDASNISQLCTGDIKTINYQVLNITRIQFPFSTNSTDFYKTVEFSYNNEVIFKLTDLLASRQKSWDGLPEKEMHFYIKDLLINQLALKGMNVYWEQFENYQYPYHLVFVSPTAPTQMSLNVDGAVYGPTTVQMTTEVHSNNRKSVLAPNTLLNSDKINATLNTPYFKTSYISPVSEEIPGALCTYADSSFIVYSSTINYIRKPQPISLSLGSDCEFSPIVHQDLCNKTAELALNRIADPAWKEVTQNNTLNSTP